MLALWKKSYDKPGQHIKRQRHHFANKDLSSQSCSFSSSHVQMWELNHKEGWALRNWCLRVVVLDKTLESSLDSKEVKQVNPRGNNSKCSLEGMMLNLKLQYLATRCEEVTHWKRSWSWERTSAREGVDREWDVGWHHWINGHELEQTPGDSEGQVSLVCCSPWGRKESDVT